MDESEVKRAKQRAITNRYNQRHPDANRLRAAEFRKNNPDKIRATEERYRQKRDAIVREAKSVPCKDCGVSYPYYVMDFDHVRGEKEEMVSQLRRVKIETLLEEIAKCDVVCANCHRERTHQQGFC